jgi:hypothetical protein
MLALVECVSCLEEFAPAMRTRFACGHTLCLSCVIKWAAASCPSCRRNITAERDAIVERAVFLFQRDDDDSRIGNNCSYAWQCFDAFVVLWLRLLDTAALWVYVIGLCFIANYVMIALSSLLMIVCDEVRLSCANCTEVELAMSTANLAYQVHVINPLLAATKHALDFFNVSF